VEHRLRQQQPVSGRRIKLLTVTDDFSHECVDITVDWGISGQYVGRLLDRAAIFRSYPLAVRTDNGPGVYEQGVHGLAQSHGVHHIPIEPGWPMQNGYIESFNGNLRDEFPQWTNGSRRCSRPEAHRGLAAGLQREQTPQRHRAHPTGAIRRSASPAR
jgi:transposase InsO family protein